MFNRLVNLPALLMVLVAGGKDGVSVRWPRNNGHLDCDSPRVRRGLVGGIVVMAT